MPKIDFPNQAREWDCPTEMWEWELAAEANTSDAPAPEKHEVEILNLKQQVETLTQERNKLRAEVDDLTAKLQTADGIPDERSETTYLNIIAAGASMCGLVIATSEYIKAQPQSYFELGIAERSRDAKWW